MQLRRALGVVDFYSCRGLDPWTPLKPHSGNTYLTQLHGDGPHIATIQVPVFPEGPDLKFEKT